MRDTHQAAAAAAAAAAAVADLLALCRAESGWPLRPARVQMIPGRPGNAF